jgi:hypothetical protein
MQYELRMMPEVPPMRWSEFKKFAPPFSAAIDGFVCDGPKFDKKGPHINLNHHEKVDRLGTRATCAQALLAVRQRFYDCFRNKNGAKLNVYANDCDQDVCVTHFVLKYGYLSEHAMNPALNRLVSLEDKLDATAGAYPLPPDLPILGQMAYIFEPYSRFRFSGGLDSRNGKDFYQVVMDVESRIMQYIMGDKGSIPLELDYNRIGGGKNWTMVIELGAQARTQMFVDGIHAYLSVRQRAGGKSWSYTAGRMSKFIVSFDLPRICRMLNRAEGLTDSKDQWGGADNVIGSPRIAGSTLAPKDIEKIINSIVK